MKIQLSHNYKKKFVNAVIITRGFNIIIHYIMGTNSALIYKQMFKKATLKVKHKKLYNSRNM